MNNRGSKHKRLKIKYKEYLQGRLQFRGKVKKILCAFQNHVE